MSLLFKTSKVLRNNNIQVSGKITLKMSCLDEVLNTPDILVQSKKEIERKILEAKEQQEKIIEETKLQKQRIINEANENSRDIEKKAYELGYEQGLKNGYEDGYKESYEQNIEKALKESEAIKQEGYNTLLNIKSEMKEYIKYNKEKVLKISIAIAEQVLREKFKDTSLMNKMIENIIEEYDLKKDIVIKVNSIYKDDLEKYIKDKIEKSNTSQKVFIIADSIIEEGNAEIQSENGKLTIGINNILDKVREELL